MTRRFATFDAPSLIVSASVKTSLVRQECCSSLVPIFAITPPDSVVVKQSRGVLILLLSNYLVFSLTIAKFFFIRQQIMYFGVFCLRDKITLESYILVCQGRFM